MEWENRRWEKTKEWGGVGESEVQRPPRGSAVWSRKQASCGCRAIWSGKMRKGFLKWKNLDQHQFWVFSRLYTWCCMLFRRSALSDALWPHGLQHTRLPCPSPSPGACSDSCLSSQWCRPTISSSVIPFSSCLQYFPASNESALRIRWPKYWSFSISPSNEYSGMISFRIDWFDLLSVQGTLKSLLQHHSFKASILRCFMVLYR